MWNGLTRVAIVGILFVAAHANAALPSLAAVQRPFVGLTPVATLQVGKTADWIVITADAVWVGSTGPNAVHRIDPKTNRETAGVMLPGEPCAGLVAGFDALWIPLCGAKPELAKVALHSSRPVTVLDFHTAAECGIAASTDSVWLVVDDQGTLARIDPSRESVAQTVRLPPGSCNPRFSNGVVWVTSAKGAELTAVDAKSGAILATIPTGPQPRFLTAGGASVWTLNQGDGTVTQIDIRTRRATGTIALETPGPGGDIAFGARMLWTTMVGTPLTAIDPTTHGVVRQWVGPGGDSLAIGHNAIWLTDYHKGTIARIRIEDALAP